MRALDDSRAQLGSPAGARSTTALQPCPQQPLTPSADIAARETPTGRRAESDRPALAAWHAGWAVAAALLALGGRWLGGVVGPVFHAVLALVVPGVTGLFLLHSDGPR